MKKILGVKRPLKLGVKRPVIVFNVAGCLIRGRRRWSVTYTSPRELHISEFAFRQRKHYQFPGRMKNSPYYCPGRDANPRPPAHPDFLTSKESHSVLVHKLVTFTDSRKTIFIIILYVSNVTFIILNVLKTFMSFILYGYNCVIVIILRVLSNLMPLIEGGSICNGIIMLI